MTCVSNAEIDAAWQSINALAEDGGIEEFMERLNAAQPAVLDFVLSSADRLGGDAADLLVHSALVIWDAFGRNSAPEIQHADLMKCGQAAQEWLDDFDGEAVLLQKKLSDLKAYSEPNLMGYVIDTVFECGEDGLEIEPEDQRALLILLKAMIDAFHASFGES